MTDTEITALINEQKERIDTLINLINVLQQKVNVLESKIGNYYIIAGTEPPENVLTEETDEGTIYFHYGTEDEGDLES
jgi:uncharacterized protein YjgD (DUF1641 family)